MPEIVAPISREYAAGDDHVLTFTVTDKDGNAANITGWTLRFYIARRVGGTAVISTEVSPATAVAAITDAPNGVFTITIDKADNAALDGTYYFECDGIDTSSDESTITRGYIDFVPTHA